MRRLVRFVAAAALVGCGATGGGVTVGTQANGAAGGRELPAAEFDSALARFRYYSGVADRRRLVVRDEAAWRALWAEIARDAGPPPAAPAVNFATQMVIVASMGERGTGGFTIAIDGVAEHGGALEATVTVTAPGRGCGTTQAVTAPLAARLVPRGAGEVRFVERSTTQECE